MDWEDTGKKRHTKDTLKVTEVSLVQQTLDISSKPLKVLRVLSRTVVRRHGIARAVEDGIQKRHRFLERLRVGRAFHCFLPAWRARFRSKLKLPRQAPWACPLSKTWGNSSKGQQLPHKAFLCRGLEI